MAKSSPPAAPDPYQTAGAQYQYGTQAADYSTQLNDLNTVGPTGSTNYAVTGYDPTTGAPIRTQTTTLTPQEQAILSGQQAVQGGEYSGATGLMNNFNYLANNNQVPLQSAAYSAQGPQQAIEGHLDTSGVPGIEPTQNYEQYGQNTALAGEEAAAQPGLTQAREQLDASLRNSGAHPGDPAYDNAMSALDASQTQQQTQMAGAAIQAGTGLQNTQYGEEANTNQQLFSEAQAQMQAQNAAAGQMFGQGVQGAELQNSAGQTALNDYSQELGIPLNDLSAILSGSQVAMPGSVAPTSASVSAPDIMSAFQNQYNGQLAGYNANVASTNADIGAGASLAYLAYLAA